MITTTIIIISSSSSKLQPPRRQELGAEERGNLLASVRFDGSEPERTPRRNTYVCNPHLGLINGPPLFCFSQKQLLSLLIYYQKGQTYYKFWPRLYEYVSATREIPAVPSWGSSWGSSIFSQSETPQSGISCIRKVLIKRNTF